MSTPRSSLVLPRAILGASQGQSPGLDFSRLALPSQNLPIDFYFSEEEILATTNHRDRMASQGIF
jgi:hypothetical protein